MNCEGKRGQWDVLGSQSSTLERGSREELPLNLSLLYIYRIQMYCDTQDWTVTALTQHKWQWQSKWNGKWTVFQLFFLFYGRCFSKKVWYLSICTLWDSCFLLFSKLLHTGNIYVQQIHIHRKNNKKFDFLTVKPILDRSSFIKPQQCQYGLRKVDVCQSES